ncbi:MAG: hypothetical protein ACR2K2_05435 [Mycobacteriales bacterium]
MNVLTIPRTAVALEYKALRYPAQLLETRVVAALLPEESSVRLAFERLLGTLDSTAGSLLADQGLKDRGRVLTRRADVVEKAASLEAKAQQRTEQADAQLRAETEQAQAKKAQAEQVRKRKAEQLEAGKRAAKAAVEQTAQARKKADKEAIGSAVGVTLAAERDRADEQKARIDGQAQARTAAPKAELKTAVQNTQAAQQHKADADRLAELADAEAAARQH